MKKILFTVILLLMLFWGYDVSAACYRVSDAHSGQLISYTNNTSNYQDTTLYKISVAEGSKCSSYTNKDDLISCGKIGTFNKKIPEITSWLIIIVQIAVPVILAIIGAIDFFKSIISQKDDEIKKGQQMFIKRIITAIIIFFVVAFAKVVVSLFGSGDVVSGNIVDCIDCFISNDCD